MSRLPLILLSVMLVSCSSIKRFRGGDFALYKQFNSKQQIDGNRYVTNARGCFPENLVDERQIFTAPVDGYKNLMYQLFSSELEYDVLIENRNGIIYKEFKPTKQTQNLKFEVYYCYFNNEIYPNRLYGSFRVKR